MLTTSVFGWIYMMSRNGSGEIWNRTLKSYKDGFKLGGTDFWLGLERIHQLTSGGNYRLRIEIEDLDYIWYSVEYPLLKVGSEMEHYPIKIIG